MKASEMATAGSAERWAASRAAGLAAFGRHQRAEAEAHYVAALREAEAFGPMDLRLVESLEDLVELYERELRAVDLERTAQRLLDILERVHGSDAPEIVGTLNRVARARDLLAQPEAAEAGLRRGLVLLERALGTDHPGVTGQMHTLAVRCMFHGQHAEAEALWLRARRILEAADEAGAHEGIGLDAVLDCLEMNYRYWGRHAEAEAAARNWLTLRRRDDADALQLAGVVEKIGQACQGQGKLVESEFAYREAMGLYERWFRRELRRRLSESTRRSFRAGLAQNTGHLWWRLAAVFEHGQRDAEAADALARSQRALRRALKLEEARGLKDDLGLSHLVVLLADVYRARGKLAEAEPLYRRLIAVHECATAEEQAELQEGEHQAARARLAARRWRQIGPVRREYAAVLRARGREVEAMEQERLAGPG